MTLREFHNGLRIMRNIDGVDFLRALYPEAEVYTDRAFERWEKFQSDPYSFFIRADDDTAAKLWTIIEKRMTR